MLLTHLTLIVFVFTELFIISRYQSQEVKHIDEQSMVCAPSCVVSLFALGYMNEIQH